MSEKTAGQTINALAPGAFVRLEKIKPAGSLEARKLEAGTLFYWRFTQDGKTHRIAIGAYDSSAPPRSLAATARGYSVAAARAAAEAMAKQHHDHRDAGGWPALQAAQRQAREKAQLEQQHAEQARQRAAQFTLAALMQDYADLLEVRGRRSHKDVRSIARVHIVQPWPALAATAANEVTTEAIADMIRRTLQAGHGRTANKMRSYLRAAYEVARTARSKADIPVRFKSYAVTLNPAAGTAPSEAANAADKNPLAADELRVYWRAIKALPGLRGAVLRLHLLTGGQRIEQLVNLRTADVSGESITLFDGKGRPGKPPRPHAVPLLPLAAAALLECKPAGQWALSTDGGTTHIAATTLSAWAQEVAEAAGIAGFQAKRIRSGVETILAGARMSVELRGRLQSHGISGVQSRHYDGHDYMDEKREALEVLLRLLESADDERGNVRLLTRRKAV